jgi:hypothetical protein
MAQIIKRFEQAIIGDVVKLNHDIHGETGKLLTVVKAYEGYGQQLVQLIDSDMRVFEDIPAKALALVKRYE